MHNNIVQFKNKLHILLIVSFISVAIISFFFVENRSEATLVDDYNAGMAIFEKQKEVNADEPKNKDRIGIDDIVYNRVPFFDVNIFTNKPGGQDIVTDSALDRIRTAVANWFIRGMFLSLAVMIIIIMYTGIRMALSTIAEKQAEYKEMLFSFVKAIAKIFVLAAIVALIINLSQFMTNLFAEVGPRPDDQLGGKNLYVTMVTRALGSFSFKAKVPAAILFFGLSLTFFKFCYKYAKRMLNVYLLLVLAPILVAKDAYEGASGKQGKTFSAWIQEFTLNVALQPAHALIYSSLVYIALKAATDNILAFVVAVLIMNFMISADKLFFRIFNMRFTKGPGSSGAADAVTEGLKMYAGVQAAKEGSKIIGKAAKGTIGLGKRAIGVAEGASQNISNKLASSESLGENERKRKQDKANKQQQKDKEKRAEEEKKLGSLDELNISKENRRNEKRQKHAEQAQKQLQGVEDISEGKGAYGFIPAPVRNYMADAKADRAMRTLNRQNKRDNNFRSQLLELHKISTRNDETGRIARKLLKMKRDSDIKKFKYVAGAVAGVAGQTLALIAAPGLIASDESDMALMGVTSTMGNTTTAIAKHYYYRRNAKDELLTQRSFEDTIQSLKNVNADLGTLQAKFDAIEEGDREARKDTYNKMAAYSELKLDEQSIRSKLNSYMVKNGIKTFDAATLEDMIDKILAESGITELGIEAEGIKNSLMAEMLNAQVDKKVGTKFVDALNHGTEDGETKKNRYTLDDVLGLAKDAVEGEDISELSDKQIRDMVSSAIQKADIEDPESIEGRVEAEVLRLANEQRESKFVTEMQSIIDEDSTYEQLKSELDGRVERIIERLAIENRSEKDKYVNIVVTQLGMSTQISEEQRRELIKSVEKKVEESIKENYKNKNKERIDTRIVVNKFAENEKKFVDAELDKLGDSSVLSKDVRQAISNIKRDVKHEKTKKGSIGTITDLDRRLRHMRDVL